MSYKTCPEWPELMELAPECQFKHMSLADARLPFEVVGRLSGISLTTTEICCDAERHVFNAAHTDSAVTAALEGTHWFEVHEWATSGPGSSSSSSNAA